MRVLAVVHGPTVGPELFADVAAEQGHELGEWDIRLQGPPPADGFHAVMVFGGDQNVGEEVRHPWLNDEYEALRRWIAHGTPLFAVCLGSQTLAHAAGGRVRPVGSLVAGFFATELTDEGAADPVLGVLPRRFDAFNVNAYWFEAPPGAVELAVGPVPQAYRLGERAWATQFHPEVRHDQALDWLRDEPGLPRPLVEIAAELDEKLPLWQEQGRALCRAFLRQVSDTGGV
jgi:GMP synthase (glutamine-hydrolysing)